jgi:hypothetical protein
MDDNDIKDEYSILQFWYKKKSVTVADLVDCDERYWRYLHRIVQWKDEQGNDYSYVRNHIYQFVNIENALYTVEEKFKRMKYIDGEIMMMMNMILMQDCAI